MNKFFLLPIALFIGIASFITDAEGQTRPRRSTLKRPLATKPKISPKLTVLPTGAVKTASGLTYLVTQNGTGRLPKIGETVVVHYTGTLTNGVKFDSSRDSGTPIEFPLGKGRVIKGWDEGIAKLRIGDQAILIIPPAIAYGAKGAGNGAIPPNATLIFIVELVDIK